MKKLLAAFPISIALWTLALALSCGGGDERTPSPASGWRFFDFSPGGHFRYELQGTGELEGEGSYTLDVEAMEGGVLLKWEASYTDRAGEPIGIVSSDPAKSPEEAQFLLSVLPPAGPLVEVVTRTLIAPPQFVQATGRDWQKGNSRKTTLRGEAVQFQVVGACSYGGVDGLLGRWTKGEEVRLEVCASPSVPMVLMAHGFGVGGKESQATLVEYRSR